MKPRVGEKTARVFLVDDNKYFLQSLTFILNLKKDMEVVGTSSTASDALKFLEHNRPDIVVVDMILPDMDGIALLEVIRDRFEVPVIVLSMYEEYRRQALRRGAFSYIVKGEGLDILYDDIRRAFRENHAGGRVEE